MSKERKTLITPYVWQRHSFSGARLPKSRTARSFLLMVPWMTLMVIGVIFFCLIEQLSMRPGRVLDLNAEFQEVTLPEGRVEEGILTRFPTAILRKIDAPDRPDVTVLLLDDGRYSSDNLSELEALSNVYLGEDLNLIVDKDVSYGATMVWVERLKGLHVERINFVTAHGEED